MEQRSVSANKKLDRALAAAPAASDALKRVAARFNASTPALQAHADSFYNKLLPRLAGKFSDAPQVIEACASKVITVAENIVSEDKMAVLFDHLALDVFDQVHGRLYDFEVSLNSAFSSSDNLVMDRTDNEEVIRKRDTQALFERAIAKAQNDKRELHDKRELLEKLDQLYRLHLSIEARSENGAQEQFVCGVVRDAFYDYVTNEIHPYVAILGPSEAYFYLERLVESTNAITALLTAVDGALHAPSAACALESVIMHDLMNKRGIIESIKVNSIEDQALCIFDGLVPDFNDELVSLEISRAQAFVHTSANAELWEFVRSPYAAGFSASCAALFMAAEQFEGVFVGHADGRTLILSREEVPYLHDSAEIGAIFDIPNIHGNVLIKRHNEQIQILSNNTEVWSGDLDQLVALRRNALDSSDIRVSSIDLDSKILQIIAATDGRAESERALRAKLGQALMMIAKCRVDAVQAAVDLVSQICVSADRATGSFSQRLDPYDNGVQIGFGCFARDPSALDVALEIIDAAASNYLRSLPADSLLKDRSQIDTPTLIGIDQLASVRLSLSSIFSESLQLRFLHASERQRLIDTEELTRRALQHRDRMRLIQPLLVPLLGNEARAFVFELIGRGELMASASTHLRGSVAADNSVLKIVDLPVEPLDYDEAVLVARMRDEGCSQSRRNYYANITKLAAGSGILVPLPKIESSQLVRVDTALALAAEQNLGNRLSHASRLLADYEKLREKIEQKRILDEARAQRAQSIDASDTQLSAVEHILRDWIADQLTNREGEWDTPVLIESGFEDLAIFALDAVERDDAHQFRWALEDEAHRLSLSFDSDEFDDLFNELKGAVATVANTDSRNKADDRDLRTKIDQFFRFLTTSERVENSGRSIDSLIVAAHETTRSDEEIRALADELVNVVLKQQMPSEIVERMLKTFAELRNKPQLGENDFLLLERQAEEALTIPGRGFLHDGAIYFLQSNTDEILDLCASVMQPSSDFDFAGSSLDERIADIRELWGDLGFLEPADARAAFMILGTAVTEAAVLDRLKYELLRDRPRARPKAEAVDYDPANGPINQPPDIVALVLTKTFPDTLEGASAFRANVVETLYQRYIAPIRIARSSLSDNSLGAQAAKIEGALRRLGIAPTESARARAAIERGELPSEQDREQLALPEYTGDASEQSEIE